MFGYELKRSLFEIINFIGKIRRLETFESKRSTTWSSCANSEYSQQGAKPSLPVARPKKRQICSSKDEVAFSDGFQPSSDDSTIRRECAKAHEELKNGKTYF